MKIHKSDCLPIDKNFKGSFRAYPYKAKPGRKGDRIDTSVSMIYILESDSSKATTVFLAFDSTGQLNFTYSDSGRKITKLYKGRFSDKGYYEYYLKKKIINIPPLLPLIYSRREVDRFRIAVLSNNDLLIDNLYIRDGNILLLGGGGSFQVHYYFKKASGE